MRTEDVKKLVGLALDRVPKPYTEHVIDDVFAVIEGDPERWINFVHHDDAAAAVARAADRAPAGATYNVADADPQRRREYYTLLGTLLGRPAPAFVPRGPGGPGRRVLATRIATELGFDLRYKSVREGLPASL